MARRYYHVHMDGVFTGWIEFRQGCYAPKCYSCETFLHFHHAQQYLIAYWGNSILQNKGNIKRIKALKKKDTWK